MPLRDFTESAGAGAASQIADYLDTEGHIAIPDGATLTSYLDHNVAQLGDAVAYRFLDYSEDADGRPVDLTWHDLGTRLRAVGARLQQVTAPGDRVAILAPQGLEYVVGFFAAIATGNIAVPLFVPELPGQAERLEAVLDDAEPSVVLTTSQAAESVQAVLRNRTRRRRPRPVAIDAIPAAVGSTFVPAALETDDIAYLQYTSGSTRAPAGVEITHREVCTNVVQMILSLGLDWNVRGVSWLPLFHDMGLLMIMFPALCSGQMTMMSPMAFVRRPHRWIQALADESRFGRTFSAAPNFAFDVAVQRGLPRAGKDLDLSNVAGLINGSEPVSMASIERFNNTFGPYGLPTTAVKPSYGMAEATLFVSTTDPGSAAGVAYLDREQLGAGHAVRVDPSAPDAVRQVSCGRVARSLWAVIVDASTDAELPDGEVGEIWLHGDNIGSGYWRREEETELAFRNKLQSRLHGGSHADGAAEGGTWFKTGDLGVYLDGELYIIGRIKDLVIIDGRNHYPQDIEATVAQASAAVRAGYAAAFSVPSNAPDAPGERLVIVAERAPGAGTVAPQPVVDEIRAAVSRRHALSVADVRLVPAGTIPRTTSGKLAHAACRAKYLAGVLDAR
ncbi:fatty acyl-AMP ligase [Mycolicibacterium sp. ND9-15]|uniref:fatty acyl-AMP ligase n=1 Tax=Mycolicibacterium sp. ND9-15 TaxID=3042320 RepID=UPI002DDC7FD3|nr:fatty acyl-AMP ligase [Mycolicibacterium sp. ND9-15]WSE56175.1 fatty acyl-AMP ligase [Mycolicibacterium sp. ND9-15]